MIIQSADSERLSTHPAVSTPLEVASSPCSSFQGDNFARDYSEVDRASSSVQLPTELVRDLQKRRSAPIVFYGPVTPSRCTVGRERCGSLLSENLIATRFLGAFLRLSFPDLQPHRRNLVTSNPSNSDEVPSDLDRHVECSFINADPCVHLHRHMAP